MTLQISMQHTSANVHQFVSRYNEGRELKDQVRGAVLHTLTRLLDVFYHNFNAGKCREYQLVTNLYGIATQTKQSERTILRHIERLRDAEIIHNLKYFRSSEGYRCTIDFNLQIVHFQEIKKSKNAA